MNGHARFAPSSAHRYIHCAGSVYLCESMPAAPDTLYGLMGSAAHLLAQRCLELGIDAALKIGTPLEYKTWKGFVNTEIAGAVQVYLDEIRRKRLFTSAHFIEQWVNLSWLVPDCSGTADHIAVELLDCLYVDDFKYGAGVAVEVKDNPQLMIYGLGALGQDNKYGVNEVELTIVQPRAIHPDGPIRKVRISTDDLYAWGETVLRPAIEKALIPNQQVLPGDWCRWCEGKLICPAIRDEIRKTALTMFDDALLPIEPKAALPEIKNLTAEQLDRILTFSPVFSSWLSAVHAESVFRLESGAKDAPKAWKLVQGKSSRQWKNEAVIRSFVSQFPKVNAYSERIFKSPAQLETEFKTAKLDTSVLGQFIDKRIGQPNLVAIDDPRPALGSKAESMFGLGVNPFEE